MILFGSLIVVRGNGYKYHSNIYVSQKVPAKSFISIINEHKLFLFDYFYPTDTWDGDLWPHNAHVAHITFLKGVKTSF